jgi:hypothetical protein
MDYQKEVAKEELTLAQTEIKQLHEDKDFLEVRVARLYGALRSLGHDPADFTAAGSPTYGRIRNVDSPTFANTFRSTYFSPQNQNARIDRARDDARPGSMTGANSAATGAASNTGERSAGSSGPQARTLQQLIPETVLRNQPKQPRMQSHSQQTGSASGGKSLADLLSSKSTTQETIHQRTGGVSSHNSSEGPDPAECAPASEPMPQNTGGCTADVCYSAPQTRP